MEMSNEIRLKYERVLENISRAARKAGRAPSSIKLVVVTKSHPVELASAAIESGARILGENYAEEGLGKIKAIGDIADLEWHMIGHIQSRKAELVVRNYSLIHSLDSFKLATRLSQVAKSLDWSQPVLIQVNVSGEESKFGYSAWNDDQFPPLFDEIEKILSLSSLKVQGLMTVPPFVDDSELVRPYFSRVRMLRDKLIENFPGVDWSDLSMGMSADYVVAIEEGATYVRVGSAILGERIYPKG